MLAYKTDLATARCVHWWIGTDGKRIYAAVRSELPPQGDLLARVRSDRRDRRELNMDDGIELWLAPAAAIPLRGTWT